MGQQKSFGRQLSDISLRQLRIFRMVADSGGFAAAEVELGISGPAISVAVSDLESHLALKLCQRGRSGFSLTDEGSEVYNAILQLFTSMDTFTAQVTRLHDSIQGDLNIGITDNLVTMPHMTITQALADIKLLGSGVRINIRMIPPNEVERNVVDGQLHVGVVPASKPIPALNYLELYDESSHLYCSHEHPLFRKRKLTIEEVTGSDTVMSSYAQEPAIKRLKHQFNISASATDREGVAFLILTGRYIGFLPDHYAENWIKQNKMKALLEEKFYYSTGYSVISRKGSRPNRVVEAFLRNF